ncbi:TPA: hypothetical protein ACH3X3_009220 [Trebouxia sp. C0006]
MNTRHSDTQLEHRKAYLQSLQTTSKEFKAARDKIPRGRSKQWYSSGHFWGKNYIVGLILRAEKFRLLDEDELFKLRKHSPQYTGVEFQTGREQNYLPENVKISSFRKDISDVMIRQFEPFFTRFAERFTCPSVGKFGLLEMFD